MDLHMERFHHGLLDLLKRCLSNQEMHRTGHVYHAWNSTRSHYVGASFSILADGATKQSIQAHILQTMC